MDKVENPKTGDKRTGDRRRQGQDGAFAGPDRRQGERRGGASAGGEGRKAQGQRNDAAA